MTEELKPLPCPWCGAAPREKPNGLTACSNPHCGVFSINMTLEQWNTRSPAWRDDMENVPDSDKRVMFWRSKLKRVIICRADDYWVRPRPHWFDDVTHWQLPLPPEETK